MRGLLLAFLFVFHAFSFANEPRPMGLELGKSTKKEVIEVLKTRGAKEVFEDKAYFMLVGSRREVGGLLPGFLSQYAPKDNLLELSNLSSVIAYNVPQLGKDSLVFAFFAEGKLFYLKYLIPFSKENKETINKVLSTLRKKYKLKSQKELSKFIEDNMVPEFKNSLGLKQFNLSNVLMAERGNILIFVSVVQEEGKKALSVEYADLPTYEDVSKRAKEVYRRTRTFEGLF